MGPRRLSDSQKQDLVGRYKAGESTAALAALFGCSSNTVSRTVRALLPADAYEALKASRQKGGVVAPVTASSDLPLQTAAADVVVENGDSVQDDDGSSLALDDADDFGEDLEDEIGDDDSVSVETFTELAPLAGSGDLSGRHRTEALAFSAGVLPASVYMLVDKVVELDARPLREFPELGLLDETELERKGLCLFNSPRAAKRQCSRNQRVIKVPDTGVFARTSSYLLARGISRLVMEGQLIALDR